MNYIKPQLLYLQLARVQTNNDELKTQVYHSKDKHLLQFEFFKLYNNKYELKAQQCHTIDTHFEFFKLLDHNKSVRAHSFTNIPLYSDIGISDILKEINILLPQLSNFISQFNNTINESGINVITDSIGGLSIDVPQNMPDDVANRVTSRIGILDRLINTRSQEINDLLQKGTVLENKLKSEDSNYIPRLADKIQEYRRLNALYKH
uniref:hypothetical protein n=1 Tax=Periconia digitata TaxID=1303443 RepID=UPI0023AA5848|nr:hypothetical protein P1Q94_mgp21 [Periconia digitata]WCA44875.1 hypothetical protein [Periconia digitata]